ncbi:MAG TPA: glycosyltransferase family 2 protein [Anaerovoracaceae bacterium]|nr:glycosyltransferase family 2 protein [Anaerovoracaceae bacterium]
MEDIKISIIVSVYNEQEVLPYFHQEMIRVLDAMKAPFELIYVNDGSFDYSQRILEEISFDKSRIKVINFSKNFGHEAAMIAGIDNSTGDFIVCIDADLEKPPSEVVNMYRSFRDGYDVVNMVYCEDGNRERSKQYTAKMYYKFLNKISRVQFVENASDFFGISRRVANVLKEEYREKRRYLRGYIQSMGFRSVSLQYVPNKRYAGESKYNFKSLFHLAVVAITDFSDKPLQLGFYFSVFCLLLMGVEGISLVHDIHDGVDPVPLKMMATIFLFLFAIMFFLLGILGIYLGDIQKECKKNPIYLIKDKYNF